MMKSLFSIIVPLILLWRKTKGKEDLLRINERKGISDKPRPDGQLIWFHAASVGEAQSTLIMMDILIGRFPNTSIMITSGTKTSAQFLEKRLPENAFHQYAPMDNPKWVERFLAHWKPDMALWMESELWPNTLSAIKQHNIPAALLNARMSPRSAKRWAKFPKLSKSIIDSFDLILTQTDTDTKDFKNLGAQNVRTTGNLKYASEPLPADTDNLNDLTTAIGHRSIWLFASTHEGEENIAAQTHKILQKDFPNLLTIIVPRHPERRQDIAASLNKFDLETVFRGEQLQLPTENSNIYVADTMGELGLFYRLTDIAVIGRSLACPKGGGGHNPIEAAQLNCAVLYGPLMQNFTQICSELENTNGAIPLKDHLHLSQELRKLLSSPNKSHALAKNAYKFAQSKHHILDHVTMHLEPLFDHAGLTKTEPSSKITP